MESNTKTIAKRARVEPRTQMHMTMKKLFSITLSSTSIIGSPIIVLDNVLKLWIELIKWRNDNAREKFYLMQTFSKARNFVEISKILKNLEILKIFRERRSCSTSYSSGNQVDGSPLVAMTRRVEVFFLLGE